MHESQITDLIADLPPWLQVSALIVLIVLCAVFGKRLVGRSATRQIKRSVRAVFKTSHRRSRPEIVRSGGRPGSGVLTVEPSPGQVGKHATRELSRSEVARVQISYDPHPNGDPDPGEVVWTWVPYVENDGRGKDRPVLIIGRFDRNNVVGCYMSTTEHRGFIWVGAGAWDARGRESYLNPERLLLVNHDGLRREGAVLPRKRFEDVTSVIMREHRRNA